jgi:hypothetical protein
LARAGVILAAVLTLVLAGCGGEGDDPASSVPCSDAAFRAQDEELYVTRTTISNAIGGGSGDQATLLLDLHRARAALAGYLDAHPPCDDSLLEIAATEHEAIGALDDAITALDAGDDARKQLASALEALTAAQNALGSAP